jgi:hypothetical protein
MGLKAKLYNKDNVVTHTQVGDNKYVDKYGNDVLVPDGTVTDYVFDEITDPTTEVDAYRVIAKNDKVVVFNRKDPEPTA